MIIGLCHCKVIKSCKQQCRFWIEAILVTLVGFKGWLMIDWPWPTYNSSDALYKGGRFFFCRKCEQIIVFTWLMVYSKLFDLVGCWIMYEVADNKMHELVAYELMSANDVPERDPRDWYVLLEYPITNWCLMHNYWLTSISVHATWSISLCPSLCFVFYCFHFVFQMGILKLLWIAVWKRKNSFLLSFP